MMFRSFCMGKKDNDREISEWYNEGKLGRQIGICRAGMEKIYCEEVLWLDLR